MKTRGTGWLVWTDPPEPVVDIDTPLADIDISAPQCIGRIYASLLVDAQRMAVRITKPGVVVWVGRP